MVFFLRLGDQTAWGLLWCLGYSSNWGKDANQGPNCGLGGEQKARREAGVCQWQALLCPLGPVSLPCQP